MSARSQTDTLEQMLIQIPQSYTLSNRLAVFSFLREHPFVAEVLIEAAGVLAECFGRRTLLSLELMHDPEADDPELFAYAHVDLPAEEALTKLRLFDERWFFGEQARIGGLFNVDVCLQ